MSKTYQSDFNFLINPSSYMIMFIRAKQLTKMRYNSHSQKEGKIEIGIKYRLLNGNLFRKVIDECRL
uniref:Uncharacterized protein n=1 Tax=Mimiviridae sp. ChoanoV1 TaxID=2596887 RepID=A0A5B8IEY1_9VIRU|nr:hypothetical protein 1_283 [Mimiviridae sp. ChoanoV1]